MSGEHRRLPPSLEYATGLCSTGKRSYYTRAGAKALAKRLKHYGDKAIRAYLCEECDHFHAGHIPTAVRLGVQTRAEWRAARW